MEASKIKKIFLTGTSGFLGWNIGKIYKDVWKIFGIYLSNPIDIPNVKTARLDITDYRALKQAIATIQPDLVLHTAAIADANYCQDHRSESEKVNVIASVNLAGLCADRMIPFVFTSSDLVFDGREAPYKEEDPVSPINFYGEQKAIAEQKIHDHYPKATIFRVALLYGDPGPVAENFFHKMVLLMKKQSPVSLFMDEFRTPLSGEDAAKGILELFPETSGMIIHLSGKERISRYDLGLATAKSFNLDPSSVIASKQSDIEMAAPRPTDVSLDNSKALEFGFNPDLLDQNLTQLADILNPK